ncbi:MAG: hypothetical protein NT007_19000 [Candidatus Kapabacteria bacterium]|nr:hypothetical protein [Candidatus Kapabacteria bacterium]
MITKKFSKTYDECLTQAYLFQSELVVDQTLFTAASPAFAAPFAANFLADIEAADAIPTNENDLNSQSVFTAEVEEQMDLARAHYQKLLLYIGIAWPGSDVKLKAFGNNLYEKARKSPPKMANLLQSSYLDANSTTYKADLIAAGFLQTDITLLDTLSSDLTNKINAQQDFMRHTFTRSEERAVAFNKVWDTMVKISNSSKLNFKDSPAKIEFYLLYPSSGGGGSLTAPMNFAYNFGTNTFSWDAVTNATSYQIEASDNGTDWAEIYADAAANFVYIPASGAAKHYRVRARNSGGFGDFAAELAFTYYDSLAVPTGLALGLTGAVPPLTVNVNWDAVAGATEYKVERSIVNTGAAAGTYTLVDTVGTNSYSELTVDGKRYYFYVIAANSYRESAACAAVWVDVPVNPV